MLVYMLTMYVGFTGRAAGITRAQVSTLRKLLQELDPVEWKGLHNNGEGSDQTFSEICIELGFSYELTPEATPMQRNRLLVARASRLIAVPPSDSIVKKGSGTWETIKYMWRTRKPVHIILSDGRVRHTRYELVGGVGIEPT